MYLHDINFYFINSNSSQREGIEPPVITFNPKRMFRFRPHVITLNRKVFGPPA